MYRYQVGQKVTHNEVKVTGVVTRLVSFDEEEGVRLDVIDPKTPWYDIMWDEGRVGFEHDESLE